MKQKKFFVLLMCIILGMSLLLLYGFIEPYLIEVHHVWIQDAYLGRVLEQKIIVQLSDLHIGNIGRREQRVLKILFDLQPDIIFLTGDYVKWDGDYEPALTFLSQLKAKIGIWAVMGDYDYKRSRSSCLFCHEKGSKKLTKRHHVHFLRDYSELIKLADGTLWIANVEMQGNRLFSSKKRVSLLRKKDPTIFLSHSPLSFHLLNREQNFLMLAGDTHGGQVSLPYCLWRFMGYKKNALYSQGLFENGHKKMFVSRGIGTSHLPFRLFRRPEVVVLHFMS